jgi:hypothetical protein
MSDAPVRRMHCPQCDEQISPLRAVFGWTKRPFDCSRCGIELEVLPTLNRLAVFPALAVFWAVKAEYGNSGVTLGAFVLLLLLIAILQLVLTPVRRYVPR